MTRPKKPPTRTLRATEATIAALLEVAYNQLGISVPDLLARIERGGESGDDALVRWRKEAAGRMRS